jgi:putative peptidoglycan lipid II flippase
VSEHTRFVAPARLVAALTAASRVLGLVREIAFSYFFGILPLFSSYRVAFMVPNLARRLFGEGAMASSFVPVFTEVLHKDGRDRARALAGTAFTLLGAGLCALALVIMIGLGIAHWLRPSPTLHLTIIMMPYMVLICLAGFAGGMLNSLNRFGVPAAAPILLNVVLILVLVVGGIAAGLDRHTLVYAVAIGVLVAGVLQFGAQLVEMRRADCWPKLNLLWRDPDLRRILALMGPMVVGLSAMQLNVLADNLIALFFVPGGRGPAVLGYAHMLYHLPQGVFGIALATAIFPLLSAKAAQQDHVGLARTFESGIRVSVFIALPASLGLILLADPIVALVYQHRGGQFGPEATDHVSRTLIFYCLGLWAFSVQPTLARAFYALQDARTPVRVGVTTVALNLILSFVLVFPLAEGGIALATAIASAIQVVWLAAAFKRRLAEVHWPAVVAGLAKTAVAVAVMSAFLIWLPRTSLLNSASDLILLVIAIPGGAALFALTARLLRCQELSELLSR